MVKKAFLPFFSSLCLLSSHLGSILTQVKAGGFSSHIKIKRINHDKVWEWTAQAHRFYTLVTAHAPLMKKRGVLPEELQQAKAGIEALLAMKDRSSRIKGNAESATQERNRTLDALRAWHVEFRAAARLALKDMPQRLEAFGMKIPS